MSEVPSSTILTEIPDYFMFNRVVYEGDNDEPVLIPVDFWTACKSALMGPELTAFLENVWRAGRNLGEYRDWPKGAADKIVKTDLHTALFWLPKLLEKDVNDLWLPRDPRRLDTKYQSLSLNLSKDDYIKSIAGQIDTEHNPDGRAQVDQFFLLKFFLLEKLE